MVAKVFMGRYQAVRELGSGAMGRVFLAEDRRSAGRSVVVKVMHDHVADQARFRQLFESELQMMARFRHPGAVRLLDGSADDPNGACIVMEYIRGRSLEEILRREKWLSVGRTALLLGPLCHAMSAAHEIGVIHRDLKPGNLMVTDVDSDLESIKVMDLGLAMFAARPYIPLEVLKGEGPGFIVGTPAYIPPEQVRGDEVDGRGDIYSLGVTLFEMMTGSLPFPIPDSQAMLEAHLCDPPPRMREIRPDLDIPEAVDELVRSCMNKFPHERPRDMEELARGFGDALDCDLWGVTRPAVVASGDSRHELIVPSKSATLSAYVNDPNAVIHEFDAWMPEKIAVIKLRGFVDDHGGEVIESEPGRIRVIMGRRAPVAAGPGGGVLGWIGRLTLAPAVRAAEPSDDAVLIELRMEKPDPRANQLHLTACYRPSHGSPARPREWHGLCDRLHNNLRAYLIAGG